ncbi:Electron transfer DM13 [Chryseolinea serpens]|uniref:Electron transfer DM13 n=1 Tax=Chryseolinea serpens TaxID=947013 RepID=A0A1M5WIK6_9BACT|nr:DM13 domain-containing protein [Chryseolinea serpens]SHH87257.1 Electron transfer DM13 [Chryseolinea serpens]
MKKYWFWMCFALASCQPEAVTPTEVVDDNFDTAAATLIKKGMLEGINHTASGTASIYTLNGNSKVVLDPYMSQSGPDLKIYLSKDIDAGEYIRLGNLKSTMGKQVYDIPKNTDLTAYPYVHVWCEKYTVVFARAELK